MSDWLGLVWLLLLLFAAGWGLGVVLTPLALRGLNRNQPPTNLRRRLWLVASLPLALPAVAVAGLLLLAAAKQLGWLPDHCPLHGSAGHPHFCFVHRPELAWRYGHGLFALAVLTTALMLPAWPLARVRVQQHRVRQLDLMAARKGPLRILETDDAQAFAAGLRHPRVFLSRGLLNGLSARERRIVVAHEVAHIRHGDLTGQLVFECLLRFHRPECARTLRRLWQRNMEERADDRAAARFGALDLASTLVKLARQPGPTAPAGTSALGDDPAARMERLLQPGPARPAGAGFELGYGLAAAGVITVMISAHHSLETLLGYLPGI